MWCFGLLRQTLFEAYARLLIQKSYLGPVKAYREVSRFSVTTLSHHGDIFEYTFEFVLSFQTHSLPCMTQLCHGEDAIVFA